MHELYRCWHRLVNLHMLHPLNNEYPTGLGNSVGHITLRITKLPWGIKEISSSKVSEMWLKISKFMLIADSINDQDNFC